MPLALGTVKRVAVVPCRLQQHDNRAMANIYDVAKRARVSAATVSAVLNDSAFVSAALRSRVLAAVKELHSRARCASANRAERRSALPSRPDAP